MSGYTTVPAEKPSAIAIAAGAVMVAAGTAMLVAAGPVQQSTQSLYAAVAAPAVGVPAYVVPGQATPSMAMPQSGRMDMSVYGKGRGGGQRKGPAGAQQSLKPPTPPVDPDNEEFVLFVRSAKMPTVWIPYTIVTGGTQANQLVKSAEGNMMKEMFSNQLIRSIGEVIYRDQSKIEKSLRASQIPVLKGATKFEYGFKVRDKSRPEAWIETNGVIKIPPKDQLPETPVNKLADGVKGVADKLGLGKKN